MLTTYRGNQCWNRCHVTNLWVSVELLQFNYYSMIDSFNDWLIQSIDILCRKIFHLMILPRFSLVKATAYHVYQRWQVLNKTNTLNYFFTDNLDYCWSCNIIAMTSFKSLFLRGCLLFAVGVFFAYVLNLLQVQQQVTEFPPQQRVFPDMLDNLFCIAWWVPPSCGTAAGKAYS